MGRTRLRSSPQRRSDNSQNGFCPLKARTKTDGSRTESSGCVRQWNNTPTRRHGFRPAFLQERCAHGNQQRAQPINRSWICHARKRSSNTIERDERGTRRRWRIGLPRGWYCRVRSEKSAHERDRFGPEGFQARERVAKCPRMLTCWKCLSVSGTVPSNLTRKAVVV